MKKRTLTKFAFLKATTWPEWSVFFLFIASFITVSIFHEPWFDEAEAWQIAKCASFKDILFLLPHYEGHPPLWHLILTIPAKLGVPFEWGLKTVAAIPTLFSVWLLLFRSPFPRPVRLLLPFNYFIFYQYGVISRPYGLMLLGVILSAMSFGKRDEKPWRFILSLLLVCLCSAYGILIAGGICICWVFDIMKEYGWKLSKALWKDHRVHALSVLLLLALLLIAEIIPYSDAYGMNHSNATPFILRLIYAMFMILPDCFLTETFTGVLSLSSLTLPVGIYFFVGTFGFLLCCLIFFILQPKYRKFFFLPWILLAIFMSAVYFYAHHIGIMAMLLLFTLWSNGRISPTRSNIICRLINRFCVSKSDLQSLRILKKSFITLLLLIPLYWTLCACMNDIQYPYFFSRETAAFLKESGLSKATIMSSWVELLPEDQENSVEDIYQYSYTNIQHFSASISAYFPDNIFYTFNKQADDQAYILHRLETSEETKGTLSRWRNLGAPDVLIGRVDLEAVFGDEVSWSDYTPVYKMDSIACSIWKAHYLGDDDYNYSYVYLRKDLLDDYGLAPLSVDPFLFGNGITDFLD